MPYVNKPRPYAKEYQQQLARGEAEDRTERAKARWAFDKKHGKEARKGKDLGHNKALSKGGSNKDGYKPVNRSKNRAHGGRISRPPKK